MLSESHHLKLSKLKSELLLKTEAYYEALKEGKSFQEVRKLYLELKQVEKEFQDLLGEYDHIGDLD